MTDVKSTHTTKAAVRNTLPSMYRGKRICIGDGSIKALPGHPEPNESRVTPGGDNRSTAATPENPVDRCTETADRIRVLAAGVDNVFASVACDLDPGSLSALQAARDRAQNAGDAEPIEIAGRAFLMSPSSSRSYTFRLSSPVMDIWAQCEGKSDRPPLLIELRSLGIHMAGVEALVEEAHQVAAWCCPPLGSLPPGDGMKISRIDLYGDIQGWIPTVADNDRFVGRARLVADWDGKTFDDSQPRSRHRKGRTFSGFTFGRGRVCARVYNKTLLMAAKGSDWMTTVWRDRNPDEPVWRVEVQLRRGVLRDFSIGDQGEPLSSVRDALQERQALWRYGVCEWLTLRVPRPVDSNWRRWPVDPVWRRIQDIHIGSPCSPLVRVRHAAAAHERLVQGMAGYLTSLLAHGDTKRLRETVTIIDAAMATGTVDDRQYPIRVALEGLSPVITSYCDRRKRRFLSLVDDKARKNSAT